MKPATALAVGLCLSIATGFLGYRIGRASHEVTKHLTPERPAAAASRAHMARPAMSATQAQELTALLDSQTDPLARFAIALDNMEDWVAADPAGALAWLSRQPVTARRNEVIRLAISQWAESDPASAASWSQENLKGVELHNTLIRLAEQWVASDPVAAARWFARLPDGPLRLAPIEGLFFRWASKDPTAAREFVSRELASDPHSPQILQAIHAGWAKTDPQAASASSLQASRQSHDPGLFANTLANWATIDVASSAAWLLKNVQPGPERSAAIHELAGMFAQHDPASGIVWLEQLATGERSEARNILATTWAQADAASAAKWLASLSATDLTPETTSTVLIGFLSQDAKAFTTWRDSLPNGPLKQKAAELSELPEEDE